MATLVGCGSDVTSVKPGPLSGVWNYNATNLAQPGVTCSITGLSLTITQSGDTFTGTVASGGVVFCRSPARSDTEPLSVGDIVANGILNDGTVAFDIGSATFHNVGSISGTSMSGKATIQILTTGTNALLAGDFTAVKQ
jgi:hypothetical protein